MKILNQHNLPDAIVNAIINKEYNKGNADYSVTELAQPPQLRRLFKRYYNELEVDASSMIWSLFGTAVHHILEMAKDDTVTAEQRFYIDIGGYKIGGMPDIVNYQSKAIDDYKVTSIFKIQKGDYKDWEAQLNCYRLMVGDKIIDQLRIRAILKDWSHKEAREAAEFAQKTKALEITYPQTPVVTIELPIWNTIDTVLYMANRIKLHLETTNLPDDKLPQCTKEERWASEDEYAIYSKEKNYTYRTFTIKDGDKETAGTEAYAVLSKMKATGYEIIERPGKSLRCEYFCAVSKFCHQYQNTKPQIILDNPNTEQSLPPSLREQLGQ